jgi:hypothetical protein
MAFPGVPCSILHKRVGWHINEAFPKKVDQVVSRPYEHIACDISGPSIIALDKKKSKISTSFPESYWSPPKVPEILWIEPIEYAEVIRKVFTKLS